LTFDRTSIFVLNVMLLIPRKKTNFLFSVGHTRIKILCSSTQQIWTIHLMLYVSFDRLHFECWKLGIVRRVSSISFYPTTSMNATICPTESQSLNISSSNLEDNMKCLQRGLCCVQWSKHIGQYHRRKLYQQFFLQIYFSGIHKCIQFMHITFGWQRWGLRQH
jgi:hypothetical protein